MSSSGLTRQQRALFEQDGYVVVRHVFSLEECQTMVAHMRAVHDGRERVKGVTPCDANDWQPRVDLHMRDPRTMGWLLDERLRGVVDDGVGGPSDGVETRYLWRGEPSLRCQDACRLPHSVAVWIALMDMSMVNGTVHVQVGSHHREQVRERDGNDGSDGVERQFVENGLPEVPVIVSTGSVLLMHGGLIHRDGPVRKPEIFRHVLICHYIPYDCDDEVYRGRVRFSFDGEKRVL